MASEYKPNIGVITVTANTTLNVDGYAGKTVALDSATGRTITLPAATGSGACFTIVVTTTVSSGNHVIQVANSSDVMAGTLAIATDIAGVTVPTTSTSDTITMNGGTQGGIIGSTVILEDVKTNVWAVRGALVSSSAEATPFSAAV